LEDSGLARREENIEMELNEVGEGHGLDRSDSGQGQALMW